MSNTLWSTEDKPWKQQEKNQWFTSDNSCGYCFLSRSVAVKEMCCIFWMLVTHVMPTGCGLSIRRLHRSRRTWQPYRYISSQWTINPSDSTLKTDLERQWYFFLRKYTSDRRDQGFQKINVAAKRQTFFGGGTRKFRRCWNLVKFLFFQIYSLRRGKSWKAFKARAEESLFILQ